MALSDSRGALGAVTQLLQDHLIRRGFEVSVGKPEQAADTNAAAKLNLFLYEMAFDPSLRNHPLRDGEPPPLWLVLKYLLTAFDEREESDSAGAHELLGRGLAALQELSVLPLDAPVAASVRAALENNPEPLKLTFDESSVDLLAKIMQGTDERYRLSVAFQMRPVMIVPDRQPRASLLVGVNYTTAPQTIIGEEGVQIDVLPSMGPRVVRVDPPRVETGATVAVLGEGLASADIEVVLGDVLLTVLERRGDRLIVAIEGDPGGSAPGPIASGATLSAGELPLSVRRRLSPTRVRSSNLIVVSLLPTVGAAGLSGPDLVVTGLLLGRDTDDVIVALYRESDGATVRAFDEAARSADQQTLTVSGAASAVAPGDYLVIVRVNDQQARSSPRITVP